MVVTTLVAPILARLHVENILRKDNEVGELANLKRAFRFFAAAGECRSSV